MELAVMASGGIAVPIFAFFHKETAELLIQHSDARFLAVAGELQLERLDPELPLDHVFSFDAVDNGNWSNLVQFNELLASPPSGPDALFTDADPDAPPTLTGQRRHHVDDGFGRADDGLDFIAHGALERAHDAARRAP